MTGRPRKSEARDCAIGQARCAAVHEPRVRDDSTQNKLTHQKISTKIKKKEITKKNADKKTAETESTVVSNLWSAENDCR